MDKASVYGNYRAKVVNNKDPNKFGRVLVWIPDLMPEVQQDKGIWARPANNPLGGRNMENDQDNHFVGTSYIPKIGSWVFVFFEGGNINRPYYFGALDLENTPVLPENQLGSNYEDKWTLLKSHEGRALVVSDDPDDARVEVTGKKRQMTSPPTGDTGSVYTIDGNQTTILLDERDGNQKLLIRTYKGDFINIDIDTRILHISFNSDFEIKSNGTVYLTAGDDINIKSLNGDVYIEAEAGSIYMKSALDNLSQAGGDISDKASKGHYVESTDDMHRRSGNDINHDAGGTKYEQSGTSDPAKDSKDATSALPRGNRNKTASDRIQDLIVR